MRFLNEEACRNKMTPAEQRKLAKEAIVQAHRLAFKYNGYRRASDYLHSQLVLISKRHSKDIYKFIEVMDKYKELNQSTDLF